MKTTYSAGLTKARIVTDIVSATLGSRYYDEDVELTVSSFVNGREEGLRLSVHGEAVGMKATDMRYAAIAENRNSDSIVVYLSNRYLSGDANCSGLEVATQYFFSHDNYTGAAASIVRFFSHGVIRQRD